MVESHLTIQTRRSAARLALLLGLTMVYAAFAYVTSSRAFPRLCPWYRITGAPCPLCGFTTATGLMMKGEPRSALRANPQWPFITAGLLAWYAHLCNEYLRSTHPGSR